MTTNSTGKKNTIIGTVNAVDDTDVDGTQIVTVTATAGGFSDAAVTFFLATGSLTPFLLVVLLYLYLLEDDPLLFLLWLQTPVYWLHQFEKYVYPGGFARFRSSGGSTIPTLK